MEQNCVVLIPACDPPRNLLSYLKELADSGFVHIILVDDGSGSDWQGFFDQAERMGCMVIRHLDNRGKGSALKAGLDCYQEHFLGKTDGVVLLSGNVRFPVECAGQIARALREERTLGLDRLILGNRDFSADNLTKRAQTGNKISRTLYHFLLGIDLQDVQTGLRGIPDSRVPMCKDVSGKRYEYDAAMLIAFEDIGYREVLVQTLPAPGDAAVKYQNMKDTLLIGMTIFRKFLMFAMTSILVSVFDIFLFWLFTEYFMKELAYTIIWSTILARVISATVNYIVNRNVVFRSNADQRKSACQFLVLSIIQCALSAILVHLLEWITSGNAVWLKVIVDTLLFFANYKVQQIFIFKNEKMQME